MMVGYGWRVLRNARAPYLAANSSLAESIDVLIDAADLELWSRFRQWMASHDECFIKWDLHEQFNNHRGILMSSVISL